ncbi:hypothetical protein ROTO_33510 [Roseovarius tolerans]|uniref:Uncharacterized protein n=1 Tax=Roseovarius tolerans TaxID=74031 RepID=A0A0L6CRF7_9RHOB|nr:hypothetical protein ROTO_33510 [Roseovarius tolerans]
MGNRLINNDQPHHRMPFFRQPVKLAQPVKSQYTYALKLGFHQLHQAVSEYYTIPYEHYDRVYRWRRKALTAVM